MRASARARIAQVCNSACPLCYQRRVMAAVHPAAATRQTALLSHSPSNHYLLAPSNLGRNGATARHASSLTSLSAFTSFFKRKSSQSNKTSVTRSNLSLEDAVAIGDLKRIATAYRKAVDSVRRRNDSSELGVRQETLDKTLQLLARSSSRANHDLIKEILQDYTGLFGWLPSAKARRADLLVTCATGTPEQALDEMKRMRADGVEVTLHDWNAVVRAYSAKGRGLEGIQAMETDNAIQPDIQTYTGVLTELSKADKPSAAEIDAVLKHMASNGLEPDEIIETTLLRAYDRAGLADKVHRWRERLKQRADAGELSIPSWSVLLLYTGQTQGFIPALEVLRHMQDLGIRPDSSAMSNLAIIQLQEQGQSSSGKEMSASQAIELVHNLERETGLPADKRTWTVALRAVLGTSIQAKISPVRLQESLQVYHAAIADGVHPDAEMVEPLILGLCDDPTDGYEEARHIYQDLMAAEDDASTVKASSEYVSEARSRTQQRAMANIQRAMLFACMRTEGPSTRTSACIEYLDEMRRLDITFDRDEVASRIIGLMRSANDHYEAFKLYSYGRALDPDALTAEDYSRILVAFAHLSFPKDSAVPPKLFFEFLRDMRRSGYPANAALYTELISQYTKLLRRRERAGKLSFREEEDIDRVVDALRRVHANLKLDSFVEMDIPLLNALMDAYNQVSAWAECNEVWEEILARRPYERDLTVFQPSLNIILDACGYAGASNKARNIWRWASNGGLPLNRSNHEAWIECLCRLGCTLEATQLVCNDYKTGANSRPKPNADMLLILLKFAWRSKETYRQVPPRIKEAFPELWESVKHRVETKRSLRNEPTQEDEGDV